MISMWQFIIHMGTIFIRTKCMQIKKFEWACVKLDPPITFRNWISCIRLDHTFKPEIFLVTQRCKSSWPSVHQKWGSWYSSNCSNKKSSKRGSRRSTIVVLSGWNVGQHWDMKSNGCKTMGCSLSHPHHDLSVVQCWGAGWVGYHWSKGGGSPLNIKVLLTGITFQVISRLSAQKLPLKVMYRIFFLVSC